LFHWCTLKSISYNDFLGTVAAGKKAVNTAQDLVMPALGADKNVMCYIDDIYVYIRSRSDDAVHRGRPPTHEEKSPLAADTEKVCLGEQN